MAELNDCLVWWIQPHEMNPYCFDGKVFVHARLDYRQLRREVKTYSLKKIDGKSENILTHFLFLIENVFLVVWHEEMIDNAPGPKKCFQLFIHLCNSMITSNIVLLNVHYPMQMIIEWITLIYYQSQPGIKFTALIKKLHLKFPSK